MHDENENEIHNHSPDQAPDFTAPAIQLAALTGIKAISIELDAACELVAPDDGEPDAAAFRAALARASVLLADLSRWAGAVG